jgi:hypothetical protein
MTDKLKQRLAIAIGDHLKAQAAARQVLDWGKTLDEAIMPIVDELRSTPPAPPALTALPGPFRQGSKIRRHIYAGPTEHDEILIAVGDVEKAAAVAAHVVKLLNADAAGAS